MISSVKYEVMVTISFQTIDRVRIFTMDTIITVDTHMVQCAVKLTNHRLD